MCEGDTRRREGDLKMEEEEEEEEERQMRRVDAGGGGGQRERERERERVRSGGWGAAAAHRNVLYRSTEQRTSAADWTRWLISAQCHRTEHCTGSPPVTPQWRSLPGGHHLGRDVLDVKDGVFLPSAAGYATAPCPLLQSSQRRRPVSSRLRPTGEQVGDTGEPVGGSGVPGARRLGTSRTAEHLTDRWAGLRAAEGLEGKFTQTLLISLIIWKKKRNEMKWTGVFWGCSCSRSPKSVDEPFYRYIDQLSNRENGRIWCKLLICRIGHPVLSCFLPNTNIFSSLSQKRKETRKYSHLRIWIR